METESNEMETESNEMETESNEVEMESNEVETERGDEVETESSDEIHPTMPDLGQRSASVSLMIPVSKMIPVSSACRSTATRIRMTTISTRITKDHRHTPRPLI